MRINLFIPFACFLVLPILTEFCDKSASGTIKKPHILRILAKVNTHTCSHPKVNGTWSITTVYFNITLVQLQLKYSFRFPYRSPASGRRSCSSSVPLLFYGVSWSLPRNRAGFFLLGQVPLLLRLRMDSFFSSMRCALWIRRSRMASATEGLAIVSCQAFTGNWLVSPLKNLLNKLW